MLVLLGLLTLGSLTVLSVQSGIAASGHERFKSISLYAAESGVASATEFLRQNKDPATHWSAFVSADNATPTEPPALGVGIKPGEVGNLFADDQKAWFEVTILNNVGDPGFAAGNDEDARVILRATGHGPNGATSVIEVEVRAGNAPPVSRPCPVYGQKGLAEDGAGRNDCLSAIEAGDSASFRPGDTP